MVGTGNDESAIACFSTLQQRYYLLKVADNLVGVRDPSIVLDQRQHRFVCDRRTSTTNMSLSAHSSLLPHSPEERVGGAGCSGAMGTFADPKADGRDLQSGGQPAVPR
jgi:hypothetical protein